MSKIPLHLDKPTLATLGLIVLFAVMLLVNAAVLWGQVSQVFLAPPPKMAAGPIDAATLGKAVELLQGGSN